MIEYILHSTTLKRNKNMKHPIKYTFHTSEQFQYREQNLPISRKKVYEVTYCSEFISKMKIFSTFTEFLMFVDDNKEKDE